MYNSILGTGKVGPPVAEFAKQACSTEKGAEWLTSYLDPAHGSCDTYPDEDNNYSFALQSKFNFTIGYSDFVSENYKGTSLPENITFTIYATPFADMPLCIYGAFYPANATAAVYKYVFVVDSSFQTQSSKLTEFRAMYKGFTCTYSGNMYNNEGVMTVSQYMLTPELINDPDSGYNYWNLDAFNELPKTSGDIARCNRDYLSYRQDQGCYCSQKIAGSRSEYHRRTKGQTYWGAGSDEVCTTWGNQLTSQTATSSVSTYYYSNLSWIVCNISGLNINQSLNLSVYGGYQCHFSYSSGMNVFQTNKSYLDMAAIEASSQLSASIPCIYPSSYNDFKSVWRKIKNFFGSQHGRLLVDTISTIAGPYGGLISAAGDFIASLFVCCITENFHGN